MISPNAYTNHRDFLKAAIAERASARGLSLRAFAAHAGLSASFLSRIVAGQRHLSAAAAVQIGRVLDLGPEEEAHLLQLVALQHLKVDTKVEKSLRSRVYRSAHGNAKVVSNEAFKAIAEWQHFAILGLSRTQGFRPEAAWIAKRLAIPKGEAEAALERLAALQFIRLVNGRYVFSREVDVETKIDAPSRAVRENHRQNLLGAERALTNVPVEFREFINCSFAMNRRDVPKAKRRLRLFLDRFMRDLETEGGEELFQTNLQFYPLTVRQ